MRKIPKKYTTDNYNCYFNFIYNFEDHKSIYKLIDQKKWNNIVREILKEKIIEENKKLSEAILAGKEYVPFSEYVYDVEPKAHFKDDGKFEDVKLKVLKLTQIMHEKIRKPMSLFLIWNERHKIGMKSTDKLLFESAFQFLIDDGQIDEVVYSYESFEYIKYEPVIAIRRRKLKQYTNRDLNKLEVIKHAKKDGTLYTGKKRVIDGDDT